MKRLPIILLLIISSKIAFSQAPSEASIEEARQLIQALFEEENIVGLAITASFEDKIIWSEGFGYSDLEKGTSIEPENTLFRIASISKPFTTTILGRMYEEGIIDWEESAYTYVPGFPKKKYDFTLWHLATHRSGIRHYRLLEGEIREPLSIEEGISKFQGSKLKFEPGTDYLYSSYGYNLLGLAMEKASGKPFQQLLTNYVTSPLGLEHTIPDNGVYDDIQISGFFESNGKGKVKESKAVNYTMKLPCGGIMSTSEDLVKFGNAYTYKRILKEETQEQFLTYTPLPNGKNSKYGMGWVLGQDKQGNQIISHTGGNVGAVSRLIVYPEQKLTVALVSNTFGIDWLKFIRTVNSIPEILLEGIEN